MRVYSPARNGHNYKPAVSDEVLKVLKPIYEDSSSNGLLERYLGTNSQNNNVL